MAYATPIELHVPYIWDPTTSTWLTRPDPKDPYVPNGSIVIVADVRCSFIGPNDPLPIDSMMTYRLQTTDPMSSPERGGRWPGAWNFDGTQNPPPYNLPEYPCITLDFYGGGPDVADWAVAYQVFWPTSFEYRLWNNDLRAEGLRVPITPTFLEGAYVFTVWPLPYEPSLPKEDEPNIFPPVLPDVPTLPPLVITTVTEEPLAVPITLISVTPMGTYQGDDGKQYRRVI